MSRIMVREVRENRYFYLIDCSPLRLVVSPESPSTPELRSPFSLQHFNEELLHLHMTLYFFFFFFSYLARFRR